jgi:hypothetical protein
MVEGRLLQVHERLQRIETKFVESGDEQQFFNFHLGSSLPAI